LTKRKTKKSRISGKKAKNTARLSALGKGGAALAGTSVNPPVSAGRGVLKQIFKLAKRKIATPAERAKLVSEIAERIKAAGSKLAPADFDEKFRTESDLAEYFVKIFETMNIKAKHFYKFISLTKTQGYQSRVRGDLLQRYVTHHKELQKDLQNWAQDEIRELNNPQLMGRHQPGAKPPELVNALGDPIARPVKFDALPFKGVEIEIIKKDGSVKAYIDGSYIAFSPQGKDTVFMAFATETEIKTAGAAKELGGQIAMSQIRAGGKDVLAVRVTGYQAEKTSSGDIVYRKYLRHEIRPEHIVYSPRSSNRSGVTLQRSGNSARIKTVTEYSIGKTAKGGGETYLLVKLAVETAELEKIVRAIWPRW
jgi:hypothetical protein